MKRIADNFDPDIQHQWDNDCAEHSLSAVHILMLSQQLRDADGVINGLRSEITQLHSQLNTLESAR